MSVRPEGRHYCVVCSPASSVVLSTEDLRMETGVTQHESEDRGASHCWDDTDTEGGPPQAAPPPSCLGRPYTLKTEILREDI